MEKPALFRSLFQLTAFGIFLFQMQISVKKFVDQPIIQQTRTVTLAEVNQPVFFVCKNNMYDFKLSEKVYGYNYIYNLLAGKIENGSQITWKGRHRNVSFADLEKILYRNNFENFSTKHSNARSVFSPVRGHCKELSWHGEEGGSEYVYVTEKSFLIMVDPLKVDVLSLIEMENARIDFGPVSDTFFLYLAYELMFSLQEWIHNTWIKCDSLPTG